MYYIYVIQNKLDLRVYIGQTVNPRRRWCDHKWLAKNKPEQYIHRAMIKYGIENFVFQIIDRTEDGYKIDDIETDWINWFKSRDKNFGYNIAPGGDSPWNRGLPTEQQPMYGKKQSEYQKQRMSEIHTGVKRGPHTEEWKKNMSDIMTGRIFTEDCKNKISETAKNRIFSEEEKQRLRTLRSGTTLTQNHKDKISNALIGNKRPEISRRKQSITKRGANNNLAKLNWEVVLSIRKDYDTGLFTQKQLADKYNISDSNICNIVNYKTWKI